jgi:hypothetical protein
MQTITMTGEARVISIQRPTEYENKGYTDEVYIRLQRYNAAMVAMEWMKKQMVDGAREWFNGHVHRHDRVLVAEFDTFGEMVDDFEKTILEKMEG